MSTIRRLYEPPYQSNFSSTVWTNAGALGGYEIRLDSSNRLNVYRVRVRYTSGTWEPTYWAITRIPWKTAPKYVHDVKKNMLAVLRVIAQRQKG